MKLNDPFWLLPTHTVRLIALSISSNHTFAQSIAHCSYKNRKVELFLRIESEGVNRVTSVRARRAICVLSANEENSPYRTQMLIYSRAVAKACASQLEYSIDNVVSRMCTSIDCVLQMYTRASRGDLHPRCRGRDTRDARRNFSRCLMHDTMCTRRGGCPNIP